MNFTKLAVACGLALSSSTASFAGTWSYNCSHIDVVNGFTCKDISEVAKEEVSDLFTKRYPSQQYTVVFSLTSSYIPDKEMFIYSVTTGLRKKGEKNPYGAPIFGRSASGFDARNPTIALQKQHLRVAIAQTMAALVSEATDK